MPIEDLYQKTLKNFNEYVELLYISVLSRAKETDKQITEEMIEIYLKKRGYTMNYVSGKRIMIKDGTFYLKRPSFLISCIIEKNF